MDAADRRRYVTLRDIFSDPRVSTFNFCNVGSSFLKEVRTFALRGVTESSKLTVLYIIFTVDISDASLIK